MKRAALILLMASACIAPAQTVSDQGLMGVSGVVLLPTSTTLPKAQFRFSAGRLSALAQGGRGLNVLGFGGGLSSHVEAYARLHEDESGATSSLTSYAFGAKIRIPFDLPFVEALSLWGETVSTETPAAGQIYPANLIRTGLTALLVQNGVRPQVIMGATFREYRTELLGGAGVTVAVSHTLQFGAEALYGYQGAHSGHVMASGALRVFPGACLQIGAGYLTTRTVRSALLSVGVSVGTADVDFAPVIEEKRPDFKMPTLEEIEQQSREEGKQE